MALDGDDRDRLPKGPDRAEGVAIAAYRWALVALVGWVLVGALGDVPDGFGTQGEWFYLTLALALFAAWVIGQLVVLARRQRRPSAAPPVRFETRGTGAHGRFVVTLGGDAAAGAAGSDTGPSTRSDHASSLAPEDELDDEATARATVLCGVGHDLEDVCRAMNPRYAGWDMERQRLYREYVETMMAARGR